MSDQKPQQPRPQPTGWQKALYSPGWSEEVPAQQATASEQQDVAGEGAAIALQVFAWLDLVGGIIAGFVFFAFEQPVAGAIFVLQGIFLCTLLLGIASLVENVAAIRRRLGA